VRIQEGHEHLEKTAIRTASDLSLSLDQSLSKVEQLAFVLSQAPDLKTNNLALFHRYAKDILAKTEKAANVVLIDVTGQVVLNTQVDFGSVLPRYGNQAQLRQVFATGKTVISDVFTGGFSGKPAVSVAVPVMRQGQVIYLLSIAFNAEGLNGLLHQQKLPEDWIVTVLDSTGTITARTRKAQELVGKRATANALAQISNKNDGSFESMNTEGIPVLAAFSTAPHSRWRVIVGIPRQQLESALIRQISLMGLNLVLLFGLGIAMALFLGRRIASSVTGLTLPARDLIAGKPLTTPQVFFSEANEVVVAMADTAQLLALKTNEANQTLEKLEFKVKARTQELYDLYDQAPAGYHTLNAEGVVTHANQAQLALLGYCREEVVGQHITAFFSPPYQDKFAEIYPEFKRVGQIKNLEFEFLSKSGVHIPVLVSADLITDAKGEFVATRSTVIDNRVNLAQKQQLNEFNTFLNDVLESLPIGVLVLDKARQVVLKNKLFGRMLDYPAELTGRRDLNFSDIVRFNFNRGDHPDQAYETVLAGFLEIMATQETVHFERRQHNGTYLAIGGQRIADDWILLTYTDISAAKLSAQSLADSQQQANTANLAKSDFLSNMSHELRTPLNAVIGLAGLLAQSPLNRRQLDYAEKIQFSAHALRVLINDILDLSKIEANELHVENAPYSLHDLLNNTATILGVSVVHKPIEPVLDVPVNVPDKLFGDALRLQQILLNLISNAVKFTESGEIVLSVRYLAGLNALDPCRGTLAFCVRDTGIGMTEETQKLIFNSFTQANESTSRLYGGTGLGLAISKRLSTLMQGSIEVHSVLGQGTEFSLTLPVFLANEVAADPHSKLAGAYTPSDLKILIVDDHALARDLLTQTCRQLGWQAQAVESGAAALQALKNRDAQGPFYDLVLLDWHMPKMDGLALLREVYKDPDLELPPVLLMVATAEIEEAVTASAEFNIEGIIAKPLTPSSLHKGVANALTPDAEIVNVKLPAIQKPLSGLHLLVAEDNALNREVIEQILLNAGAQVTLVGNGQLAVEALQASDAHFDAVLMDIQMPVMDGYTATQVIRDTLGIKDLPIIALTAHARPQDREKSRLAGMTGHLVKPLDVLAMLEVLQVVGLDTEATPTATITTQLLDLSLTGLNLESALKMFGGDHAVYVRLLNKFMEKQSNDVGEARRHFSAGNLKEGILLMHDLSGIAGLLQAPDLSRLAATAELAMLAEQTENLPHLFDELQGAMDTVKTSLEELEAAMV
jgi:PAS domain S-box-containing protein